MPISGPFPTEYLFPSEDLFPDTLSDLPPTRLVELLVGLLNHRRNGDPENDAILDAFIVAFNAVLERLGLIAYGEEGVDGARVLTDPAVAPLWALQHAALYTGASLPGRAASESSDAYLARARDAAVYPLGIRRGTHEAVRRTVKPLLTGSQTVFITENPSDPYAITVRTRTEETPDPALVLERLQGSYVSGGTQGAIRAELELTYVVGDIPTWAESTVDWNDIPDGVTWNNVNLEDVT